MNNRSGTLIRLSYCEYEGVSRGYSSNKKLLELHCERQHSANGYMRAAHEKDDRVVVCALDIQPYSTSKLAPRII